MSRIITGILVVSVVMLLYQFAGLVPDSNPSSYVLGTIGLREPQNLRSTDFYTTIFGLNALVVVGVAIAAAVITRSLQLSMYVAVGGTLVSVIFYVIWDLVTVFLKLKETNEMFAVLLIAPILFVLMFSIYDWLRGTDK